MNTSRFDTLIAALSAQGAPAQTRDEIVFEDCERQLMDEKVLLGRDPLLNRGSDTYARQESSKIRSCSRPRVAKIATRFKCRFYYEIVNRSATLTFLGSYIYLIL